MKHAISLIAAAVAATTMMADPVHAQDAEPVEIERIRDRDDVTLDPSAAYLLVESPGMFVSNWIKVPTEEERTDWERQRQEELVEAIEDYPRDLSRWERDLEFWQARRNRRGGPPERPVEPTDESFAWPELERFKLFTIGPQNRFAKSDEASLWLYEVPPGEYIFYGSGLPEFIDCACMGSVRFEVPAGSVTAVRIGNQMRNARGEMADGAPEGASSTDVATWMGFYVDPPSPSVFDPRIPREMIRAAEFTPVQRLANWFGGTVNRVLPIEGVLAYDRDRVVDVQAEAAATAARAEAEAAATAEAAAAEAAAEAAAAAAAAQAEAAEAAATAAGETPAG